MKRLFTASLLCLALAFAFGESTANAQGFCGGGGWGCGGNYPYGLYGNRINEIPYFSLFPPVYYSMPVPRTYGWSPFAYPPGTMTPELDTTEHPQDVTNPYVPQNKEAKPTSAKVASMKTNAPQVQVVINPFVKSANTAVAVK